VQKTNLPTFHQIMQHFLVRHALGCDPATFAAALWPQFAGWIRVYTSAKTTFYAPSDLAGRDGMHREIIRSADRWYGKYTRRDTVLVRTGEPGDIMGGFRAGRVLRFISFDWLERTYQGALVEWFDPIGIHPDQLTGMWKVRATQICGGRSVELIPLTTIVRSCHLIPAYGDRWIPKDFHRSSSHTSFDVFYLNLLGLGSGPGHVRDGA
jgi:hypothetical protein